MKSVTLSILLAAGALVALPAVAQEGGSPPPAASTGLTPPPLTFSPPDPGWDGDSWRRSGFEYETSLGQGLSALYLGKFNRAETAFAKVLKRDADNADANLYMGVARMNLGKWEDAKTNLEIALDRLPTHPDPKSRLGVTYAMLGNTAGALTQRAELVRMAEACSEDCKLSSFITRGIAMIDTALASSSLRAN
jgi:tetratricopeptide (TPR) repeat protein